MRRAMSFLNKLFGFDRKDRYTGIISGDGSYSFDIVGESHYQDSISIICGGKTRQGHRIEVDATLVYDDNNPNDDNAIRVDINGYTVGYLSRNLARDYRKAMREARQVGMRLRCPAIIVGGWKRGETDEGHFGVKLDLPIQ